MFLIQFKYYLNDLYYVMIYAIYFFAVTNFDITTNSVPSNYDEDIRDSIGSTLATKLIIPFCQGDIPKSK